MQTIAATLRDTRDGFTRTHTYAVQQVARISEIIYHWTEGSFGCDCNRSAFLGIDELDCTREECVIALDRLAVNDVTVYEGGTQVVFDPSDSTDGEYVVVFACLTVDGMVRPIV